MSDTTRNPSRRVISENGREILLPDKVSHDGHIWTVIGLYDGKIALSRSLDPRECCPDGPTLYCNDTRVANVEPSVLGLEYAP